MKNEITINEDFRYCDYDYLEPALNQSLDYLKISDVILSVIFVSKRYIKKLNRECRGINKVTDVISFALQDEVDIESNLLGDIYICIPVMKKQSKKYQHSEKRELTFLALHGLLHLLGYDHMKPEDEKVMFGLQDEILDYLKIYR